MIVWLLRIQCWRETHLLALEGLGCRLLVEEGILRQLLLKIHGVDGRLREVHTDEQYLMEKALTLKYFKRALACPTEGGTKPCD